MISPSVFLGEVIFSKCTLIKPQFFYKNIQNKFSNSSQAFQNVKSHLISKHVPIRAKNFQFSIQNPINLFHNTRANGKYALKNLNSQLTRSFKRSVPVKINTSTEEKSTSIFKR
jgi:hypothetical protein